MLFQKENSVSLVECTDNDDDDNTIPVNPLNHLKPNEVKGIDKDLFIHSSK